MKHLYSVKLLFVALLVLANTSNTAAQSEFVPTPVEISRNKVRIGNEVFYEHIVKERQTLFSICKVYRVSESRLKECNPGKLDNGLKTGSVLMIPVQPETPPDNYKQETAEAATYGEPASIHVPDTVETAPRYISHRVRWYDSLATIALRYKVSQEEIIRLNNLPSRTLTVNQVLRIPAGGNDSAYDADMIDDSVFFGVADTTCGTDTLISVLSSNTHDSVEDTLQIHTHSHIIPFSGSAEIALLIPISAGSPTPSSNFLDFYAGVMMGLSEIKADGTDVNLHVIDISEYSSCDDLLAGNPLEQFDFVIGNFNPDNIDIVADYCDTHNVPLISPLDQKIEQSTYSHPSIVNVPVSGETQIRNTVNSIEYTPEEDNVVVIYEKGDETGLYYASLLSALDSLGVPFRKLGYGIQGGRDVQGTVMSLLVPSKENHLFIASEKGSFASDALRNIAAFGRNPEYRITTYASHRVRNLDSVDPSLFNDANMHFCLGYYVDYSDEATRQFVRQYRALFNCEPGPFAFQGHDIIVYFTNALKAYGSDMIHGIADYPMDMLQLKFKFGRRGEHTGMFNEATKDIFYGENLSIESL